MRTHGVIRAFGVCGAMVAVTGCATSALFEQELTKTNTQTVLAFEETVFNKHEVREAFSHYVGPVYIQHDPKLPDDKVGAIKALNQLVTRVYPKSRRVVHRTVAQGDLVAAQVFWDQQPGQTPGVNEVDIFRLEHGRIVEHWEVVEAAASASPASRTGPSRPRIGG